MEVRILILAKNPKSVAGAAEYLTSQGWPATVVGGIAQALEHVKQVRPQVILISYNHPSEAVYKLPEILEKSGIVCAGFVEGTDAKSADLLSTVKIGHKIFGQPIGPNLHRGVSQILAKVHVIPADSQSQAKNAITAALSKVCRSSPGIIPTQVGKVGRLGVIPFQSPEMPGYVVVTPVPEADEQQFIKDCGQALGLSLGASGLNGTFASGFYMDFPEVKFDEWAAKTSSFSFKRAHLSSEVGVAFVSAPDPMPKARLAPGGEMVAVNIQDIATGLELPFDLHLHLKANDKYYLYLRAGRQLQPEQITRLEANKVRDFFIQRADLQKLLRFWALIRLMKRTSTNEAVA